MKIYCMIGVFFCVCIPDVSHRKEAPTAYFPVREACSRWSTSTMTSALWTTDRRSRSDKIIVQRIGNVLEEVSRTLKAGQMLYLAGHKSYAVRGIENSSVLVTILLRGAGSSRYRSSP